MAMADFMVRSYGAEGQPTDRKKLRVSVAPLANGIVPEARKTLAGGEAQRNHRLIYYVPLARRGGEDTAIDSERLLLLTSRAAYAART